MSSSPSDIEIFVNYEIINLIVMDRLAVDKARNYLLELNNNGIIALIDGKVIDFLFGYKQEALTAIKEKVKRVKIYIQSLDKSGLESVVCFYVSVLKIIIKYYNLLSNPFTSCIYSFNVGTEIRKDNDQSFTSLCQVIQIFDVYKKENSYVN